MTAIRYVATLLVIAFFSIYIGLIIYGVNRPLPHHDLSYESELKAVFDPVFLSDLTYKQNNEQKLDQHIFAHFFQMIDEAEDYIVFDMFLFNDIFQEEQDFPTLTSDVTSALIQKKQSQPEISITVITDPVNTMYGAFEPEYFADLRQAGILVMISDLTTLRDSNPLYAGFYKMFFRWDPLKWVQGLPNPLGSNGHKVTLYSYLTSLNGKANHRKVLATEKEGLITSGNPHDASYYHNNTAIAFKGELIRDLLITEEAVAKYSANRTLPSKEFNMPPSTHSSQALGQVLTESKVFERILSIIDEAKPEETLWIGMLYLSEPAICDALIEAANHGVYVHIVLDQNVESFGNKKIGLPNKPVAYQLLNKANSNLQIRWYETNKEQYHPKLLFLDAKNDAHILNGSANFTRRNLEDLNLETDLYLVTKTDENITNEVRDYFLRIWTNQGCIYTVEYNEHKNEALWLRALFTLQKWTKLSTY